MKKTIAAVSSLALVASLGISVPAIADSTNRAIVTHDGDCSWAIPDENGQYIVGSTIITQGTGQTVRTKSGNVLWTCKAEIPPQYIPTKATHWTGECSIWFNGQFHKDLDARVIATPSGQTKLTCQLNGSD